MQENQTNARVMRSYYCPLCGCPGIVVEVKDISVLDRGTIVPLYRVHIECAGGCPNIGSSVDVPDHA